MFSKENNQLAQELLEVISFFSKKGWSPATSSNYSVRSNNPSEFIISRSGVDKSRFRESDFIMIDERGNILPPFDRPSIKSSAETQIHTALYVENPDINCVLHTHSVLGTVLSQSLEKEKKLIFEGLEILKGLEGNSSHELIEVLPIVSNSQDMSVILRDLKNHSKDNTHGFLIAGHGLYTWGKTIAAAKRHVETFEFLFECYYTLRRNSWPF